MLPTRKNILNNQKGSVIEFAIAFPIILLLTLGAIEISRYYIIKGNMEASVQKALDLASVIPDLENEEQQNQSIPGGSNDNNRPRIYERAMSKVLEHALSSITSRGTISQTLANFSNLPEDDSSKIGKIYAAECISRPCIRKLEFKIPKGSDTESLSKALTLKPMTLNLQAEYDSILPFLRSYKITVNAVAFREPRFSATLPLLKDCNGELGGSGQGCPCPENPDKIIDNGTCVCKYGLKESSDGKECICLEEHKRWDPVSEQCRCDRCADSSYLQDYNCRCFCSGNFREIGGKCVCPEPFTLNSSGGCVCDLSKTCPGTGQTLDSRTCQCKCRTGEVFCPQQNKCVSNCSNYSNNEYDPETCSCKCKSAYDRCDKYSRTNYAYCIACEGGNFDSSDCSCTCPAGKQKCSTGCAECPCENRINHSTCACDASQSSGNQFCNNNVEGETPLCNQIFCYGGMIADLDSPDCGKYSQKVCKCPQNRPVVCQGYDDVNGDELNCWPTCGVAGQIREEEECECKCPGGQSPCDGECKKNDCSEQTTGKTGLIPDVDNCGCACPGGQELCNNSCVRKCGYARTEGQSILTLRNQSSCSCDCPPGKERLVRGLSIYCLNPCPDGEERVPVGNLDHQGFTCQCKADQIRCNGKCQAKTCTDNKVHDTNSCACICPFNMPRSCQDKCYENCPLGYMPDSSDCTKCNCPENTCLSQPYGQQCMPACTEPKSYFDQATCQCTCPPGKQECNGQCYDSCTKNGETRSPDTCSCSCPTRQEVCGESCVPICTGNNNERKSDCSCACKVGFDTCNNGNCLKCTSPRTLDKVNCRCACPNTNETFCNNSCQVVKCNNNAAPNPTDCSCTSCASNEVFCGGTCYTACDPGKERRENDCNQCVCPVGKEECNGSCYNLCSTTPPRKRNLESCACECDPLIPNVSPNLCGKAEAGKIGQNPNTCECECINSVPADDNGSLMCVSRPGSNCFKEGIFVCVLNQDGTGWISNE